MDPVKDDVARSGISRRSVLRVGAHAAWAVPVVTIATASPAFAGSTGSEPQLNVVGATATRTDKTLTGTVTIKNEGDAATQPGSEITVTITLGAGTASSPGVTSGTTWELSSYSGGTATFLYAGTLAVGEEAILNFTITASSTNGARSATAAVYVDSVVSDSSPVTVS